MNLAMALFKNCYTKTDPPNRSTEPIDRPNRSTETIHRTDSRNLNPPQQVGNCTLELPCISVLYQNRSPESIHLNRTDPPNRSTQSIHRKDPLKRSTELLRSPHRLLSFHKEGGGVSSLELCKFMKNSNAVMLTKSQKGSTEPIHQNDPPKRSTEPIPRTDPPNRST